MNSLVVRSLVTTVSCAILYEYLRSLACLSTRVCLLTRVCFLARLILVGDLRANTFLVSLPLYLPLVALPFVGSGSNPRSPKLISKYSGFKTFSRTFASFSLNLLKKPEPKESRSSELAIIVASATPLTSEELSSRKKNLTCFVFSRVTILPIQ